MKQQYFILVLAAFPPGRLRRIHIPHQVIYGVLALGLISGFSLFASSRVMCGWPGRSPTTLPQAGGRRAAAAGRQSAESRKQTNDQLCDIATVRQPTVSVAYGIKQKLEVRRHIARSQTSADIYRDSRDITIEECQLGTWTETVARVDST